jgi:hypothetical protein
MLGKPEIGGSAISTRSLFVGLSLVIFLSAITPYVEMVIAGTQIGSICPPAGAFFLLVCLVLGVNPLIRYFSRRRRFGLNQKDLITIYSLLICTATISSVQFVQFLIPMVTGAFYYATPENGWAENIQPLIPEWFGTRNLETVRYLYEGLPGHQNVPWESWIKPLLFWAPLLIAFYFTMICICAILRKQWVERERLAFPLVQVPLEMTSTIDEGRIPQIVGSFFKNRLMWVGFVIPVILHSLDGLHQYFPSIPRIQLRRINIGAYFVGRPWNAVNPFFFSVYFSVIGFAYLLSLDLSFSFWFFFLLLKAEEILGSAIAWKTSAGLWRTGTFPFVIAQQSGGFIALVLMSLWLGRSHVKHVVIAVFSSAEANDENEPIPHRWAVLGSIGGILFLSWWCWAVGMSFLLALSLFILTYIFMLGSTRMMAEGGINFLWSAQSCPNYILHSIGGRRFFRDRNGLMLMTLPFVVWNFRGLVVPEAMEAFKMGTHSGMNMRKLTYYIMLAIPVAMIVAYCSMLYLSYSFEGGGLAIDHYRFVHVANRPYQELSSVLMDSSGFSMTRVSFILVSTAFGLFLIFMRSRFLWWPFHTIGYAASTTFAMWFLWSSIFIAWLCKFAVLRYGGVRQYRRTRPVFLGLIFGELLMIAILLVVEGFTGVRGHSLIFWQ